MAANTSLLASTMPNLTSSNYLLWALKMMNFLWASRLIWVLRKCCPEEGEDSSDQTKVNNRDNDNNHALGHILLKIDAHLSNHYQAYKTSKEVWDGLKSQFMKPPTTSIRV
ncbi:hypothetical protein PAXRUDRAFT_12042 [Paxillus rubicundulus Ve08.2h10]|uniref:DUF4219 domain-containing protein n=1 Tax=Paxillus rubicundulus Ve08.2h10 TaxID=930991 RepID=A0A0D0DBE0_9AGAM|nr:hypothetical protein PAXRUDRAFT_12042 [Paxillus rubicundulus Ve08.2h10]